MHNNKDYSTTKAISNSSLGLLQDSPKAFIKFFNQELEEKEESYFKQGSAIHCYILEPLVFAEDYVFQDYSMPNSPKKKAFIDLYLKSKGKEDEKLKKAYKSSYSTVLNDDIVLKKAKELKKELKPYLKMLDLESKGKIVLPKKQEYHLRKIKDAVLKHPKASELIFKVPEDFENVFAYNETPVYWQVEIEGTTYDLKALIDRLVIDKDNKVIQIIDLKSTRKIENFEESVTQFEYDRQLAFYSKAVVELFKQKFPDDNIEDYKVEHFIVAVNKEDEPECRVFKIKESRVLEAAHKIKELLERAHWHFKNKKWDYSVEQYTQGYEEI